MIQNVVINSGAGRQYCAQSEGQSSYPFMNMDVPVSGHGRGHLEQYDNIHVVFNNDHSQFKSIFPLFDRLFFVRAYRGNLDVEQHR